jgi:uncharacterized protein YjdB
MRVDPRKLLAAAVVAVLLSLDVSCRSDSSSPVSIAAITLTPAAGTVNVGSTLSLTAQAQDAKGNALTGRPFTFASSDTNTATCPPPVLAIVGSMHARAGAEDRSESAAAA